MARKVHQGNGKGKKRHTKGTKNPRLPARGHHFGPTLECKWCGVGWYSYQENPTKCIVPEGMEHRGVANNPGIFFKMMKVYGIGYKELIASGEENYNIRLMAMMSRGTAVRSKGDHVLPIATRRQLWRKLVKLIREKHGRVRLRERRELV